MPRPSPRAFLRNWQSHDAPFLAKCEMLARNSWTKLRTASSCCGNHGQPGC